MTQLLSALLVLLITLTSIVPVSVAMTDKNGLKTIKESVSEELKYPEGEDFARLKSIIQDTFTLSDTPKRYESNCIDSGRLCPSYKYTSITEKAIKFIVLKTYTGNEDFYNNLFTQYAHYGDDEGTDTLNKVLGSIPRGSTSIDWKTLGFGSSIAGDLLDATFGVNFTENANSSSMLGAIESKITDMRREKCEMVFDYNKCYNDVSNIFLPSQEELFSQEIYFNGRSVLIGSLKDEIEYSVSNNANLSGILSFYKNQNNKEPQKYLTMNPVEMSRIIQTASMEGGNNYTIAVIEYSDMECPFCIRQYHDTKLQKNLSDSYGDTIAYAFKNNRGVNHDGTEIKALGALCAKRIGGDAAYTQFYKSVMDGTQQSSIYPVNMLPDAAKIAGIDVTKWQKCVDTKETLTQFASETSEATSLNLGGTPGTLIINIKTGKYSTVEGAYPLSHFTEMIDSLMSSTDTNTVYTQKYLDANIPVYTLRYKKTSYTLAEAKEFLDKKEKIDASGIVVSRGWDSISSLPCMDDSGYLVRSQCVAATSMLRNITTALGAYYADREKYPDTIDQLDQNYMPKGRGDFDKNFTYKNTTGTGLSAQPDYEIRYIGKIGEENPASITGPMKRDYLALMSGSTVPDIPNIFAHIPSDSMVLYVKNPVNLLDILGQKSNTSTRLSGVDISESIRGFMMTFFELDNFDQIQSHLKNEMAIVVNNLDATAPDIVVILSEADRAALSPTAKARVVGSKDGFIFIASSKETLEGFTGLSPEKSMKNAPDFQYVWTKKSQKIRDAFIFVGDEFFENITTFETYIHHYRKYRDYSRLSSLQDLAWAYSDAFGSTPSSLSDLYTIGLASLTGAVVNEYSLADGLVVHSHIGSLKSIKTLPEARYDLSRISRAEIEDYKTNILKYRDIWRASLDPMGIVLNRYGDGMEIDFFMTPIPEFSDNYLARWRTIFEGATKDSLDFVINPRIRMGLFSAIFGLDTEKLQTNMQLDEEIGRGFAEFSEEVLDGKNILDFLGGEFAFTLGNLDPDIFEGWNVDKVDAYISIQVKSEEKGKELIDILRKKIISEFGDNGTESDIAKLIAKPLIEDYKNKKIYYVDKIPIPFVGEIGFSYAFVEDFWVLGLNRTTIKNIIDASQLGDNWKKNVVSQDTISTGTAFAVLFDGVHSSDTLRDMYQSNQRVLHSIVHDITSSNDIDFLLSQYYVNMDQSRRLGTKIVPLSYTLGAMSISGDSSGIYARVDNEKLSGLTGSVLQSFQNTQSGSGFPREIFSPSGVPIDQLITTDYFPDLVSVSIISQLDQAFVGTESLLRNVTFGLSYGDDEVGFKFRVFRNSNTEENSDILAIPSRDILIILVILLVLGLVGGVGYILYKRKNKENTTTPPVAGTTNL